MEKKYIDTYYESCRNISGGGRSIFAKVYNEPYITADIPEQEDPDYLFTPDN